jgi:hypothetical protein
MTDTLNPSVCPLCRQPNQCGAAAGEATCWCYSTAVPKEVLDRVPEAEKGAACVCRNCAAQGPRAPEPFQRLSRLLGGRG